MALLLFLLPVCHWDNSFVVRQVAKLGITAEDAADDDLDALGGELDAAATASTHYDACGINRPFETMHD